MLLNDFKGFGSSSVRFLRDLAANNTREWFQANKSSYEREIFDPAQAFIAGMEPELGKISPHFLALPGKQGGSLMRIYRDTRFAKDKSPYKTNIGIQFRHEAGRDVHAPGFYVHIQPPGVMGEYGTKSSLLAVGVWGPPTDALRAIRQRIVTRPDEWRDIRDGDPFRTHFSLEGESLVRPPRGFAPDHEHVEDLKRKHFVGYKPLQQKQAGSPSLVKETAQAFADAAPFMRFLCSALGVPF